MKSFKLFVIFTIAVLLAHKAIAAFTSNNYDDS